MIYKFIDNNGAEITVNSISSLQSLVDSETVKKNTKVKAGLRGKWATAGNIPDFSNALDELINIVFVPSCLSFRLSAKPFHFCLNSATLEKSSKLSL